MVQRFSFFILMVFLFNLNISTAVFAAQENEQDSETEEKLGFLPIETTPDEEYAENVRASIIAGREEESDEIETDAQTAGQSMDEDPLAAPPVSADAMDAIAERMKSLTQSLNGMPQPPAFKSKINLPGDGIIRKEPAGQNSNPEVKSGQESS